MSLLYQQYFIRKFQSTTMIPSSYCNSHTKIYHSELDSEKGWAESLPLQEKNHNTNHAMNSTIYKSLAKKNQQTKKINLRLMKMQQGSVLGQTCLSFFKGSGGLGDKENCEQETCKGSNIEMLKKEIKYLEQDDIDSQKFPKTLLSLSKNSSLSIENHLKNTDITLHSKMRILNGKTFNGSFISTTKNFNLTLSRERPGTSQNKQAKKYFSTKKKSGRINAIEINECQPVIHNKNHNKFELIAPFRKYFQSKRNRQNKSCTIKIEEIYGKKLSKLAHFTLQDH